MILLRYKFKLIEFHCGYQSSNEKLKKMDSYPIINHVKISIFNRCIIRDLLLKKN